MASKKLLYSVQKNVNVLKNSVAENMRVRRHLALAYRLIDRLNLNEGACNHLTAMAPSQNGGEEIMLVVPGILPDGSALHWSQVTASSLLGINSHQEIVEPGSLGTVFENCSKILILAFQRAK